MIPITVVNPYAENGGEYYGQVFNDNLAPIEVINRKLLYAIYYAQTKLVNADFNFGIISGKAQYTDTQLEAMNKAADDLLTNVTAAVNAFDTAMKNA